MTKISNSSNRFISKAKNVNIKLQSVNAVIKGCLKTLFRNAIKIFVFLCKLLNNLLAIDFYILSPILVIIVIFYTVEKWRITIIIIAAYYTIIRVVIPIFDIIIMRFFVDKERIDKECKELKLKLQMSMCKLSFLTGIFLFTLFTFPASINWIGNTIYSLGERIFDYQEKHMSIKLKTKVKAGFERFKKTMTQDQ